MREIINLITEASCITEDKTKSIDAFLAANKIPNFLQGLAAEARKAGSFENFKKDYITQIKHGIYWHWTDDPNFQIDPSKGPRDMSSLSDGGISVGKLMVTSHLDFWDEYGGKKEGKGRDYVALIDMSNVPRNAYYQVNRGFGNEFWVEDPSRAKVIKVVKPATAKRLDKQWKAYMPYSQDVLERFYEVATNTSKTLEPPLKEMREIINLITEASRITEDKVVRLQMKYGVLSVLKNPNKRQTENYIKNYGLLRGIIDREGNLYAWDASDATHDGVADPLGIEISHQFMMNKDAVTTEFGDQDLIQVSPRIFNAYGREVPVTRDDTWD